MNKVFGMLVAVVALSFYILNTLFWCLPIFLLSIFKLIPITALRAFIGRILDRCATGWVTVNYFIQRVFSRMDVRVSGNYELSKKDWYLVISNHQSWVDIVVLQRVFNRKAPFLKFFLKHELIYVPLLGLAWWALDFPFMKRYSKSFLAKHPHLKGKDLETTKKSCEKFKHTPVSIMNFMEGTRYTDTKHAKQSSQLEGLLKPKSGGVGFVLTVMGEQLHKVIDVTIYYPNKIPTFYNFLSGRVKNVFMHIDVHEISNDLIGDYATDKEYKKHIHQWVSGLWQQKEKTLQKLKLEAESQGLN
ncbi:acyltransferase [uncultured Psychrosphaera sp.]|uniref:acyltransferase n=1 Tax=uncultured Psychrosphaera sp. TaxID=1403522 RepID=UPI00263422D5|nr:acyltransferase [uncultured Psychrosphaera sp.]